MRGERATSAARSACYPAPSRPHDLTTPAPLLRLTERTVTIEGVEPLLLFGFNDVYLRRIEAAFADTRIVARGNQVMLRGSAEDVERIERVLHELLVVLNRNGNLTENDVETVLDLATVAHGAPRADTADTILFTPSGGTIKAKTPGQGRLVEAARKNDIVFAVGPAGTGKCVAADTLVLTAQGMAEIGALASGTTAGAVVPLRCGVWGLDGPEETSHLYDGGLSETRRVVTRLGFSIEATPEHPLLVLNEDGLLEWRRADRLRAGDVLALQRGQRLFGTDTAVAFTYRRNGSHDHAKPVSLDALDEPFAYLMGLVVGDGCLTAPRMVIFSSADPALVSAFSGVVARLGLRVHRNTAARPYDYKVASAALHQLLAYLGLSTGRAPTKRIPRAILRAPEPLVAAFLRGLFDTDGTVDARDGTVSLSSVSERLLREVQIVLLNFGIAAARGLKRGRYKGRPHVSHLLAISGEDAERFDALIGFGLERKRVLRRAARRNPNVDVVPHVAALIQAGKAGVTMPRATHKRFWDYGRGRRLPSYAKLEELVATLDAHGASDEAFGQLRDLARRRLLFLRVQEVAPSRARVFDLTVPGTHSFVANGFVNHNTYVGVALAVSALKSRQVKKIALCRPAVEAGESLGFLPGDFREKVDPYLRPLYDALEDMIPREKLRAYLEQNTVEIVPLAYMRGRAQPLTSRVLTPAGWRAMGDLRVGDLVIGSNGQPTAVLGVFPQGEKEVFEVTATDGAKTRCCGEHLWAVHTRDDKRRGKPPRVLETREMIGHLRAAHYHRYELPLLSAPIAFPPGDVVVEPYALGLLLGDGCFTGVGSLSFATADAELAGALAMHLEGVSVRHRGGYDYYLSKSDLHRQTNPLADALRALDLYGAYSHTKFVPTRYLLNSAAVRLGVLQGLLDSDGGPVTQAGRTCRVQYVTTSPRLAEDMLFLVRSLGGVGTLRLRRAEGRKPGCARGRPVPHRSDAFVLDLRLPAWAPPFRLRRKAEAYAAQDGGRPQRYIEKIERVGAEPVQCIRVAAPDSLYVTDDFILTHNTLNSAFVILDEAQNATASQMKMFLTRLGAGSRAIVTGDVTQTDLPTTAQSGLVQARDILEGIDGIAFVDFDRGDVVRHRLVMDIIEAYERSAEE